MQVGIYDTEEEAARNWDAAAIYCRGQTSNLNFPESAHQHPPVSESLKRKLPEPSSQASKASMESAERTRRRTNLPSRPLPSSAPFQSMPAPPARPPHLSPSPAGRPAPLGRSHSAASSSRPVAQAPGSTRAHGSASGMGRGSGRGMVAAALPMGHDTETAEGEAVLEPLGGRSMSGAAPGFAPQPISGTAALASQIFDAPVAAEAHRFEGHLPDGGAGGEATGFVLPVMQMCQCLPPDDLIKLAMYFDTAGSHAEQDLQGATTLMEFAEEQVSRAKQLFRYAQVTRRNAELRAQHNRQISAIIHNHFMRQSHGDPVSGAEAAHAQRQQADSAGANAPRRDSGRTGFGLEGARSAAVGMAEEEGETGDGGALFGQMD